MQKHFKYLGALIAIMLATGFTNLKACEIEFHVEGDAKEVYQKGDVIIVKVKVTFTHRVCPEGIDKTKFEYTGLEVLGATKWVETSVGVWERKLKIKITEKGDKLKLNAIRTCDKDGGMGHIMFKAV